MLDEELNNSRAHFDPLGFIPSSNDLRTGTSGPDAISGDPEPEDSPGVPGALAFWRFDDAANGTATDARGGPDADFYEHSVLQANPAAPALTEGPYGNANGAVVFNGETSFGFIEHDPAVEVQQGTIALWVRPDDLTRDQIFLSKDERGAGDGGHFRLGLEDGGRLFLRFANGDGGSNKAWETVFPYFEAGEWTHVAVNFTREGGVEVYIDGVKVPDIAWIRKEGNEDLPSLQSEAYILQNSEPWVLGADTSRTENNDTPDDFAQDAPELRKPFEGALADFGVWGGGGADDALTPDQIRDLVENGPGTALTAPAGPQPILAGNDTLIGGAENDTLNGDGGDDEIRGEGGNDNLQGGYGNDALDGGAGDDVLDGGRGADLLIGGEGDDLLISRSDGGEQRIGQLVIGEPTRGDQFDEVNFEALKLYGWEDQPLVADDILIGGPGRDTFYFNPLLNAKRDIILEHVNDDGTINWAGVAGENDNLHDHWVDLIGIDIVADYRAGEDTIAIVGHTAQYEVRYQFIDTDNDGVDDQRISIIDIFSEQGKNGGAHTDDLIGQIVVFGDLVNPDDIIHNAKVTHGIVETVDELQEALAPTGPRKEVEIPNGEGTSTTFVGYDSRDDEGNLGPVITDPLSFVTNPFLSGGDARVNFEDDVPDGTAPAAIVVDESRVPGLDAMVFTGDDAQGPDSLFLSFDHAGPVAGLAQADGTVAFSFRADAPGEGWQALLSKDARTYEDGGHLTIWVTDEQMVKVRYQSEESSVYLYGEGLKIEPGEEYHVAFTFSGTSVALYINGIQYDVRDLSFDPSFAAGMTGNTESLVFGASATTRDSGELNNLKEFFRGAIDDVTVLDRPLFPSEVMVLAQQSGVDAPVVSNSEDEAPADEEAPAEEAPAAEALDADPLNVRGTGDDDRMEGGAGDDVIRGGDGADTVEAGPGDDRVAGGNGADLIFGETGDDTLGGGGGRDRIDGGEGDDLLRGQGGHDLVYGNAGDDRVAGGGGRDTLLGGEGDDSLFGGNGGDLIEGGVGDDVYMTGGGRDVIRFRLDEATDEFGDDTVTDFDPEVDRIEIGEDIDIEILVLEGLSRVIFSSTTGEALGHLDVLGVALEEEAIRRIPDDALTDFGF